MKYQIINLALLLLIGCSTSATVPSRQEASVQSHFLNCANDPEKLALRSSELQEIVKADQADRRSPGDQIDWDKVSAADETRAKRVAEIFAEGCFKTARDYAAAALVFQHGSVPDHYYQAYLWSKKALELGDQTQKLMVANAIDRYLLSLGYKQLFGAQSFRYGPGGCHCLEPTENKFPDKKRRDICGITLRERVSALREQNKAHLECQTVLYCDKKLQDPPKGIIPSIW